MKLVNETRVAYKCRLDINYEAERFIIGQLECNRICYNEMLAKYLEDRQKQYELHKEDKQYEKIKINYAWVKKKYPWMYNYIGTSLDYVVLNLNSAISNWIKNFNPEKPNYCKPRFKPKWRFITASFKLKPESFKILDNNRIKLSKLDSTLKVINHRNFDISKTKSLTIERYPSGTYYAIFSLEKSDLRTIDTVDTDRTIAIDLGIKKYFTFIDTDGNYGTIENPKIYREYEDRKKFLDKKLARKRKYHKKANPQDRKGTHNEKDYPYSKRYQKVRRQKAALEEHVARVRKDFLNNLTTKLVKNYNTIIIEDISVSELVKKTNEEFKNVSKDARHNINKATYDVGWYMFTQMLKYKCEWNNRTLIIADEFYESTQLCSNCGYKNEDLKDVSIREWTCPQCNKHHDRDLNACQNLLKHRIK